MLLDLSIIFSRTIRDEQISVKQNQILFEAGKYPIERDTS